MLLLSWVSNKIIMFQNVAWMNNYLVTMIRQHTYGLITGWLIIWLNYLIELFDWIAYL